MKIKHLLIIGLLILPWQLTFGQSSKIELKDIIEGTWNIEHRGSVVTIENPDGGDNKNTDSEIIKNTNKTIEFNSGTFTIDSKTTGKYTIKGTSLYLSGKKYKFGVYGHDKFNLIRFISQDYLLTYMITRKID
jgi:hypothetical protein